jgi:hypothetical protein
VRVRRRPATSYNWLHLKDFHKWIRQRRGSRGTTLPTDTDSAHVWAVEIGVILRGSGEFVSVFAIVAVAVNMFELFAPIRVTLSSW